MDASAVKHQARLEEWRTLVVECRSSGKSVRAWCTEHGIGYKTHYRLGIENPMQNNPHRVISFFCCYLASLSCFFSRAFILCRE